VASDLRSRNRKFDFGSDTRGVESSPQSPGFGPESEWSISFEGDSDSGLCLFYLDFCVILWQSI